jgi:CheY-like chemotaxis protein
MTTQLNPLAVVEDSDEDFEALVRALRGTDVEIVRFVSGEEVLESVLGGSVRPALIVLDLNLPGVRGLEVLARLKGEPAVRAVPIVVLSGSAREEDISEAYDAGANAYVSKPLDFAELRRTVRSLHDFWRNAELPGR